MRDVNIGYYLGIVTQGRVKNKMENKIKDKILKLLKKKELSTSKIARMLKKNYWTISDELNKMKKEKLILKSKTIKGVYWEIKNGS